MKPAEKFHQHHQELINTFQDYCQQARESSDSVGKLLEFLRTKILPHARAEEQTLYRKVDQLDGGELSTSTMRKDHEILEDRIDNHLEGIGFSDHLRRRLDEFSAILLNHFRKEEEILIPFLDDQLSEDEFTDLLEETHSTEESLSGNDE